MNTQQPRAWAMTSPRMETEQTPDAGQTRQPKRGAKYLALGGLPARSPMRWAHTLPEVLPDVTLWLLLVLATLLMAS